MLTQAAREGVPDAAKAVYTIALADDVSELRLLGRRSAGRRWASTGRRRAGRATTTCSAPSGSGSTRSWRASSRSSRATREIAIRPLIASEHGIDRASASYDSVRGTIKSSWQQSAAGIRLDVTIPPNTTALVSRAGHRPGEGRRARQRPRAAREERSGRVARGRGGAARGVPRSARATTGSRRPGLFAATEVTGTVGGTVPPTLSLTLGAPAQFGAFTPGVGRDVRGEHDGERDHHGG